MQGHKARQHVDSSSKGSDGEGSARRPAAGRVSRDEAREWSAVLPASGRPARRLEVPRAVSNMPGDQRPAGCSGCGSQHPRSLRGDPSGWPAGYSYYRVSRHDRVQLSFQRMCELVRLVRGEHSVRLCQLHAWRTYTLGNLLQWP